MNSDYQGPPPVKREKKETPPKYNSLFVNSDYLGPPPVKSDWDWDNNDFFENPHSLLHGY